MVLKKLTLRTRFSVSDFHVTGLYCDRNEDVKHYKPGKVAAVLLLLDLFIIRSSNSQFTSVVYWFTIAIVILFVCVACLIKLWY